MPFRTFQLHQSFQLRVPSCQAGTVHPILSLPESFEEILTFLIPCLLGNLYDGKTCFFRRFQLSFELTDCSLSDPHCLLGILAFLCRILKGDACLSSTELSSSLVDGELCCGIGVLIEILLPLLFACVGMYPRQICASS